MNGLSIQQDTLRACSMYKIDPRRITFTAEQCPSEGGHGVVKRGSLVNEDGDNCTAVAVKILRSGDNISSSMLQRVSPRHSRPNDRLLRRSEISPDVSH